MVTVQVLGARGAVDEELDMDEDEEELEAAVVDDDEVDVGEGVEDEPPLSLLPAQPAKASATTSAPQTSKARAGWAGTSRKIWSQG
jgi:uncharacterized metal-binding protein YceD (DUF177 family)